MKCKACNEDIKVKCPQTIIISVPEIFKGGKGKSVGNFEFTMNLKQKIIVCQQCYLDELSLLSLHIMETRDFMITGKNDHCGVVTPVKAK